MLSRALLRLDHLNPPHSCDASGEPVGLDIGPEGNIPREASTPSVGHLCSPFWRSTERQRSKMTALFTETTARAGNSSDNASSQTEAMIWIPGGTFRMGSDKHYPEEAPAHRVTVDGFWMDRHPVTNRQFKEFPPPLQFQLTRPLRDTIARRLQCHRPRGQCCSP